MKLATLGVLITIIAFFAVGQAMYTAETENNISHNLTNLTHALEETVKWNSSQFQIDENMSKYADESGVLQSNRLRNIIIKGVDFLGYAMFEVAKWGTEFGYTHPELGFMTIVNEIPTFLKWVIAIMIIAAMSKVIMPLFAVLYILGYLCYTGYNKLKQKNGKNKQRRIRRA